MNYHNTTAIITGGTGALGRRVVEKFFAAGANIAIPVRSKSAADSLPAGLQSSERLALVEADVSDEVSVKEFVAHVMKKFGRVDFLVNLAGGYAGGKPIADVSLQEWEGMLELNLKTAFLMSRETLAPMLKQKFGRIITIAAMPAITSGAKKGPYAIAKRGVIALTETIADEVKGSGVTANAIAPSIIATDANKASMPDADFRRWVEPDELADLVLFLCSDAARSINGNTIKVFGGV
jgi:NAD(P)-dependent dehydrogenase (short-subunit alcohol dehydrogenase family)